MEQINVEDIRSFIGRRVMLVLDDGKEITDEIRDGRQGEEDTFFVLKDHEDVPAGSVVELHYRS